MKVLIADDDPVTCRLLSSLLNRWDYEAIVAVDGAEAWHILQGDDPPRLAILDWYMPGLDGLSVCRNVRWRAHSESPYTYILLASAQHTEDGITEGIEAGADDYLTKPFKSQELKARLLAGQRVLAMDAGLRASIAEQKQTETDLKQERNLLRTIIDTLPDHIYVKDTGGRYIIDNIAHMSYLGAISEDEVRGKTVHDFFPPELAEQFHADDQAIFESGRELLDKIEPSRGENGRISWFATTKTPIWDANGIIVGLVCVSRNIDSKTGGVDPPGAQEETAVVHEAVVHGQETQNNGSAEGLHAG